MLTVQNIKDSYTRLKRDLSNVPNATFVEWVQFVVDFVYDKTKRVDAERYIQTQSYSVVIPPQSEDLPSNFQDLNQTACGLYKYNTRKRLVVTFDDGEDADITFSDSGGTSAYNDNTRVQGSSSRGYTGDAAATMLLSFDTAIDWTSFADGGTASPNNDFISIWVYVGNSVPTSATIEFSTLSDGSSVGVNQFSYSYTSLAEGWNRIKVLKSAFTTTGSPSWSSLGYLRLIYTGGAASTNVYWDKMDLVGNEVNDYNSNNRSNYNSGTRGYDSDLKLGLTGYQSTQEGYYITGNKIVFTDSGLQDKDYVMRFLPVRPTIAELTDYITVDGTASTAPIIDNNNLQYMLNAVDVIYEQWARNPTAESIADFRFVRALGGLLDGFNRTPQISTMPNPSNDY